MIKGIGTDIIKIDRISLDEKFIDRVLSEKEKELYNTLHIDKRRYEFVAGRFAAKEAIGKALGTGVSGFNLKDVTIKWDENHKPICEFCDYRVHISISHSEEFAVAFALIEE
jgi:holo-[acyl-carrier protein] synthase